MILSYKITENRIFRQINISLRSVLTLLSLIAVILSASADDDFYLRGRVKESLGKTDLTDALIILYDGAGTPSIP